MQSQSTLARWCERVIEGGWLLAVVLIPSYFNLLSARHFEPDKATTLRAIVLVMAAAALIRWIELLGNRPATPPDPANAAAPGFWAQLRQTPLAIPLIVYVLVFLLATATSIMPATSFWGSYQRLQGTYTNLSYIGLAVLAALHLRRREQLDRLVVAMILGSLPAVGYGLVQHFQLDPLPWRGDVITRVASTMGNSIFVAAYLLLIVPYALAWGISAFQQAGNAEPGDASVEGRWAAAYLLLVLSGLLLIFSALQFGAAVRSADLAYWWVYPGALIAAFGLFLMPTMRLHTAERLGALTWLPIGVALAYTLLLVLAVIIGQPTLRSATGQDPGAWLISLGGGVVLLIAGGLLVGLTPRWGGAPSAGWLRFQAVAMLVISGLLLVTIFFTQSRGPWIGAAAALVVFFTLALLVARRRALANGSPRASLWRNLLIGELSLALALGGFLLAFNLSDAPIFQQLRQVPYIGRMGRLLETDSGTGLVRRLIWTGDEQAGGAVALIFADPLRTLIGWGPESMFVAYNKFYPPALANIESRGASPDRSHQAYLDEVVTKGLLGLISYVFVVISYFLLAWRLLRRTNDWHLQLLFIAAIAAVSGHLVEGLSGIPIVATLMIFWLSLAATVAGGVVAGHYTIGSRTPEPQPTPQPSPAARPLDAGRSATGSRRAQAARGTAGRGGAARRPAQANTPLNWLAAAAIMAVALVGAWLFNVDNVYADMRFQQGQVYAEASSADLPQHLVGMAYFLDAVRMEPQQDFYYLNLGRSLMAITDIRRQYQNVPTGVPKANPRVEDLAVGNLNSDIAYVINTQLDQVLPGSVRGTARTAPEFVLNLSLQETMSYAEAVLLRAHELSPGNKDHYANLGRLHNFWYLRLTQDPQQLQQAIDWYARGTQVAPQDVTILNEYASAVAQMANYYQTKTNDQAAATSTYDQADQLLNRSALIDPLYTDTQLRLADLSRIRGKYREAVDRYLALLAKNPHALDSQVSAIGDSLRAQPEQLQRLLAAYEQASAAKPDDAALFGALGILAQRGGQLERASQAYSRQTQLQPDNLEAFRNYTLVLSDSQQYAQAAIEGQKLLELFRKQQPNVSPAELEKLINYFKARAS